MGWIFTPPGSAGGYMAMVLLIMALIYMIYAFIRYR